MAARTTQLASYNNGLVQVWLDYSDSQLRATGLRVINTSVFAGLGGARNQNTGNWSFQTFAALSGQTLLNIPGGGGWAVTVDAQGELVTYPSVSFEYPYIP